MIGDIAQLGERLPCTQEVSGSIPLISTKSSLSVLSRIQAKVRSVLTVFLRLRIFNDDEGECFCLIAL